MIYTKKRYTTLVNCSNNEWEKEFYVTSNNINDIFTIAIERYSQSDCVVFKINNKLYACNRNYSGGWNFSKYDLY